MVRKMVKPDTVVNPDEDSAEFQAPLQRREREAAIEVLYTMGAHFVLFDTDKRPVQTRWLKQRPPLRQTLAHDGPIGIVPASIRMTAADCDHVPTPASLNAFIERYPPVALVPSRKPGRYHMYYWDRFGRTNGKFTAFGTSGEIFSANGGLILWGDAVVTLATALMSWITLDASETAHERADNRRCRQLQNDDLQEYRLRLRPFPEHLIVSGGVEAPAHRSRQSRRKQGDRRSKRRYKQHAEGFAWSHWVTKPDYEHLQSVQRGDRNASLFHTLRQWAYITPRGDNWQEWLDKVDRCAIDLNNQFPEPLHFREATCVAQSVATFCWNYLAEVKCRREISPERQRERGILSGASRRLASGHLAENPQPWIALGISRRMYYLKYKRWWEERDPLFDEEPPDEYYKRKTPEERREQALRASRAAADKKAQERVP